MANKLTKEQRKALKAAEAALTPQQRKARRAAEAALTPWQREERKRLAEKIENIAVAWDIPGPDLADPNGNRDRAAQLRREAREMATDPYFMDMDRQHERYEEIANTTTAETEAYRDRQSTVAQRPRPRPWHEVADPILDELRRKHPGWYRSDLRRELEKRVEKLPGADAIDAHIKQRENDGHLAKRAK
jgi:hypothetical protein